jgi:hypothetical protein
MTELLIFNEKVESIFQLLGEKENNISYSVGYAFSNCRFLLDNFLKYLNIRTSFQPEKIRIKLQTHEKEKGFTDFEIIQEGEFHIIVEAKRGWSFPTNYQLSKYASRPSFVQSTTKDKRIVIFNESTPAFTNANFGISQMNLIPVQVVSWQTIQQLTMSSIKIGRDTENRLLKELNHYLDRISTMQKKDNNWVYIVSLGWNMPPKWTINWQDIVNRKGKYFHPVGGGKGGWPAEPPNYIAFRYGGKLQSIHHIEKYEVFTDPSLHFSEIPKGTWQDHYLYHLGPPIKPNHEVKTGKRITRNNRVKAMIDLLLTSKTIQEAWEKSKLR